MTVLGDVLNRAGVSTLEVLDTQVDVPVLADVHQRQGDLLILSRPHLLAARTPIPTAGVTVVSAESSARNTHSLHSWDGVGCFYDTRPDGLVLGVLTVPPGSTAYLVHTEEHGANGFGPGTYEIRRQREFTGASRTSEAWRTVAD
jgi:hypothetical protein